MSNNKQSVSPRVRVIQKLYGNSINSDAEIEYPKSQYKKFIKDVVQGTIERNDLIEEMIAKYLGSDLDLKRTDKLLKIIIYAAVFELMFKHNNPTKVIINEYVKTSEFFLEKAQIKFLNAVLDKIAKNIRKTN
ncbi:MAG: antitermination protein [Pelagibacteraceae bacterium]|jgi:transcription antitermination protein NusB|nr:antitermination protein [Pelagibacteraceae bacterium]